MFRIDDPSAAASLPAPEAAGTEGYFTEGSPGVTAATLVRASWLNRIQEELRAIVVAGGLTPSKTTYNQVLTAIQYLIDAQSGNYALDTGTANVKAVAVNPAITSYTDGYTVRFKNLVLNTGATTLALSGLSAIALCNDVGGALVAGDLPAGAIITALYDAATTKFLITSLVPSQAMTQTAADARYAALAGLSTQLFSVATATLTAHAVNLGQFTGSNQSLAASGYQKLPGGLILQWGTVSAVIAGAGIPVTFPVAFTTACYSINTTQINPSGSTTSGIAQTQLVLATSVSTTGFTAQTGGTGTFNQFWMAIGK